MAGHADIGVGQEAEQPIGRLARLRGGADDGAIVLAQDLELSAAAHNAKERVQLG